MNPAVKYRIISPIGGTNKRKFSRTFLAENKSTGDQCVLKTVEKSTKTELAQERLRHEARYDFDLEGLPKVLDFFEGENELLLFLRYQNGEPIDKLVFGKKRSIKKTILIEILKGLAPLLIELHAQEIFHLDLKPSNILFDTLTKRVSLIDFGLAYSKKQTDERKTLFPLGYAAPELILNQMQHIDHRTDYFALGITIWQLCEEKLPLLHPNPSITTNLQLNHPLPELSHFNKHVSAALQRMSAKYAFKIPPNQLNQSELNLALEKGKEMRYAQINQFITDLEMSFSSNNWWRF